jgi:hypothetical protein
MDRTLRTLGTLRTLRTRLQEVPGVRGDRMFYVRPSADADILRGGRRVRFVPGAEIDGTPINEPRRTNR